MSKISLIATLAAATLAIAAPQIANDAPGVTVTLNGANVLHRAGVGYPPAAIQNGIRGTVSVQVKLDSTGMVSDAQVLSGPEELRKPVLESVLRWHFSQELAGSTRVIEVAFELPKVAGAPAPIASARPPIQQGTIRSIHVSGLSDQATAELLAGLPVHEGDEWNADTAQKATQAAQAFDEHVTIRQQSLTQTPGGATQLDLVISRTPGIIKVSGNVQSAMIATKVPPVYSAAAKAAGIQGAVHLSAIVGTDGMVQQLDVLDGPAELIQAATDAVKQWVYKPTLLNGDPVQVQTTITINFTLIK
jgi:TonB family protein